MDTTGRRITKIAREVSKFTVRTLKADGVGTAEFDFIHAVRKNPGATQAEINQILGIDKGAAARRAASLEAKGYLVRKANPADARSRLLFATEKAEELKRSKAQVEALFYEWLTQPMNEDDRAEFIRLLDTLYLRCKAESKAGFPNVGEFVEDKTNE